MHNKFYRLTIISLSMIISLVLYELYIRLAAPQVPYMDSMLYIVQLDQILKGEVSWMAIYGSGEHRGLLYPFITFIEWTFWGLDARISVVLTGLVVTAIFFYWLSAFLNGQQSSGQEQGKITFSQVIACVFAAGFVASPASFELWTLDLGFAQLVKNFLIVTFLYFLAVKQCWAKTSINALVFGCAGGFLIIFATYGWSYPFLIASLFALVVAAIDSPGVRKQASIVSVVMLAAQALYIYSGHGVFSGNGGSSTEGASLIRLVASVLYGAGTVFIGSETMERISFPSVFSMILGGLVLIVASIALVITLIERTREKIFLSALLIFSLSVLAGVAVARGSQLFTNTGASRYFVDYIWLLLGPLAIVFTIHEPMLAKNIPNKLFDTLTLKKIVTPLKIFVRLLFFLAMLGHLATWFVELKTAPYRAVIFKNMAEVYSKAKVDESDATLLQSPLSVVERAITVAQFYNLSVLRNSQVQCGLNTAKYVGGWYPPDQNGTRWLKQNGLIELDNCPGKLTIKGFIPEKFNSRKLQVIYGEYSQVIAIEPGKQFSLVINMHDRKKMIVALQLDAVTIPADVGINADTRELGLLLTYIGE